MSADFRGAAWKYRVQIPSTPEAAFDASLVFSGIPICVEKQSCAVGHGTRYVRRASRWRYCNDADLRKRHSARRPAWTGLVDDRAFNWRFHNGDTSGAPRSLAKGRTNFAFRGCWLWRSDNHFRNFEKFLAIDLHALRPRVLRQHQRSRPVDTGTTPYA